MRLDSAAWAMTRLGCVALFGVVLVAEAGAQTGYNTSTVDCSDASQQGSPSCQGSRMASPNAVPPTSLPNSGSIDSGAGGVGRNIYTDSGGFPATRSANDQSRNFQPNLKPEPLTDFQRLVRDSTSEVLPVFGRELFRMPPTTFAPADQIPVTPDYVIGPGDEVVVRVWGHDNFNGRLTVDRAGSIYIPQVGAVHVAGLRYSELQGQIKRDLSKAFRNFEMSVNLGQLRSIQVFVLGEAMHPGSYTVSSLSTAFNALLASGGPTAQGSLRKVQVQRGGQTVSTIDLYDFALRGDKSKDVTLQAGDVLFIPVVGAQVALGGSVRRPAIYEVVEGSTVGDLLGLAGGASTTASGGRFSLERISDHHDRAAMSVKLDPAGLGIRLTDGDVLHVDSVLAAYRDSVTIRGNLANAGRFPWKPGMKLSDIIPEREALLTNDYWRRRNRLGIPTPLFQPLTNPPWTGQEQGHYDSNGVWQRTREIEPGSRVQGAGSTGRMDGQTQNGEASAYSNQQTQDGLTQREQIDDARRTESANSRNNLQDASQEASRSSLAEQQAAAQRNLGSMTPLNEIKVPTPEIDWSYAVIERLDPNTLKTSLVQFNLGRLVMDHDASQDLELHAGDVVTILSQQDVAVSQDERTKYVRLEGEFASSGVYSVGPNETLADVVRRAGGLTSKAYLFGASFTRESARVMQQQRLDEYVSALSIQIERASAVRAVSATTASLGGAAGMDNERTLIQQLRQMRATGRVVLEFNPASDGVASIPAIPLENGDTFRIPSRPLVVSVVGSVYGPNVFLYNGARRVRDYLKLAGKPTRIADAKHAFIIRAEGSVFSRETVGGLWSDHFESAAVYPGDTIVVPEKPIKPSVLRDVIDWSQVFSSFALGAAAINVIK